VRRVWLVRKEPLVLLDSLVILGHPDSRDQGVTWALKEQQERLVQWEHLVSRALKAHRVKLADLVHKAKGVHLEHLGRMEQQEKQDSLELLDSWDLLVTEANPEQPVQLERKEHKV
jgi:hypothetical protein